MIVELNIDETGFKELLEGHLADLPKEAIHDIIIQSIKEYFSQDNYKNIESVLFDKRYNEKTANENLRKIINDCDCSRLQDVVDASIKNLIENNEVILKKLIMESLADKLVNTYAFRESIQSSIYNILNNRQN